MRDFAPAIDQLDARTLGFPEVERSRRGCRFQDCRHMQEPDCAVIAAVEAARCARAATKVTGACGACYADLVEGSRTRVRAIGV